MAQVTIKINGYTYTLGCHDGQEVHLNDMAVEVQSRVDSIKAQGGQFSEGKMLVQAAILMADELHDLRIEAAALRAQVSKPSKSDAAAAKRLAKLAARAEQIAGTLEGL